MKKKARILATFCIAAICGLTLVLGSCSKGKSLQNGATELPYSTGINAQGNYDSSMFFRNDLFCDGADPSIIYSKEDGYYYVYVTGLQYKRTKNFVDFEELGSPLILEDSAWSSGNYWAPEVIYDETTQKYYMYYNATAKKVATTDNGKHRIGIAVADTPKGPFRDWEGTRSIPKRDRNGKRIQENGRDVFVEETITKGTFPIDFMQSPLAHESNWENFATIDASPFFDENGDLYLYFVRHVDDWNASNSSWGVKMLDMVTPDYDTLKQLTEPSRKTVGGEPNFEGHNSINEGPFMLWHTTVKPDGSTVKKYYLTYSNYGYRDRGYSVACAIADSPLGDFTKLDPEQGMPIIGCDPNFDHMSGTGHHAFFKVGDEYFVLYHAHTTRDSTIGNGGQRSFAIDRICFDYSETLGYDLIYGNGPTYSLQPLPYAITGYRNLAATATVTANSVAANSSVSYLNDGRVAINSTNDFDFVSASNSVTVTVDFGKEATVKAILIYNGRDAAYAFSKIDMIRFESAEGNYYIKDLLFPEAYIGNGYMRPGGAAVAEFNEIKVNKIVIKITDKIAKEMFPDRQDAAGISISDITVIGK